MSAHPDSELSANQQSMLDLALGCDLRVSDPGQQEAIRARHKAIKTQHDAANYIHEVENKVHSRRQFKPIKPGIVPPPISKPGANAH
jgi:hypothetical protein